MGEITISLKKEYTGIKIRIKDNGRGIPKKIGKIFSDLALVQKKLDGD